MSSSKPQKPAAGTKQKKKTAQEIQQQFQEKMVEAPRFVAMRSDTQPPQTVEEADREGRIRLAVQMVVEDVRAKQGVASARMASLALSTPQMREHVGRLCDEASRRRQECEAQSSQCRYRKTTRSSSIPFHDNVESMFLIPNQAQKAALRRKPGGTREAFSKSKIGLEQQGEPVVSGTSKSLANVLWNSMPEELGPVSSSTKALKGKGKSSLLLKNEAYNYEKLKNMADLDDAEAKVEVSFTTQPTEKNSSHIRKPQLYKTSIPLSGFTNDNISLDLDGRRLIVVAYRPKDKHNHARKVTEVVDIPDGVDLENLKVARRLDGSLRIEETLPQY